MFGYTKMWVCCLRLPKDAWTLTLSGKSIEMTLKDQPNYLNSMGFP